MAQVSQVFGLDNPELNLDNLSDIADSDEEHRDDEIKKLLEEGMPNETFDYDSDVSSGNVSKASNHNCSFVALSGNHDSRNSVNEETQESKKHEDVFKVPRAVNGNGVNMQMLPNMILEAGFKHTATNNSNKNGHATPNGNGNTWEGSRETLMKNLFPKSNGSSDRTQKNRENEEIEVTNPTISLLHKDHCPQNENEGLGSGIWLTAENSAEQLKTLLEFRERQIQRAEETIATLTKDKRALNHQIGLMKTEMVRNTSRQEEIEKFSHLKQEEVMYLKTKIREAIEEYEQARRAESLAKEESNKLVIEIEKLKEEVKLLSTLGSSTQQAEVDDVVRQIREKHANDIASWQKIIFDLEGQLRTYKRTQQILRQESFAGVTEDAETQTEFNIEDEIERRERELAALEFNKEFGGDAHSLLDDIKHLPEREIVKRIRMEWKVEQEKIRNYYMDEIKVYQEKLISLPSELYHMWEDTQKEMGLKAPAVLKPVCRNSETMTDEIMPTSLDLVDKNTSCDLNDVEETEPEAQRVKEYKEESIQVNFAAVMGNKNAQGDNFDCDRSEYPLKKVSTSALSEEKEVSSVVVQTDETLETYKILASLIDTWVTEVAASKKRAEAAEARSAHFQKELLKLTTNYAELQAATKKLHQDLVVKQESMKKKYEGMKTKYIETLATLHEKVTSVVIPHQRQ